ncbi:hypothetical protein SEA_JUANYO_65 [Microbacterium phage Juanyo]|nr:hypothetical protein SEA_JUANYO_65 [Microbacterium phage Juanyo]
MKNKSLRDIGKEAEESRVGPKTRAAASHLSADQQLMQREMSLPKPVGAVLTGVMGASAADPKVEAMALKVIEESTVDLRLGLKEWRAVQDLVEAGIVAGMENAGPTRRGEVALTR